MARQKLGKKNIRKLIKSGRGGSVLVSLPIEIVRNLKWQAHQKVVVTQKGKRLIIEDWKK